ncbi:anthranilate N-methyltransferase-like [Mercurialis annua]|uniref:anthranilate N-methyltransferase-like n=1 Tax=Mercurialis annua TaxID=3986 RepID=UPI00216002D4|nr:anthranilate N-methyltransferase-like [Mercurialis annua]
MASSAETHPLRPADEEIDENYAYAIQLTMGVSLPMALQTAVELKVFEIIANSGPDSKLSAAEIAAKMADIRNPDAPKMLDRILRLLASHNVIGCSLNGLERLYSLKPVSYYFVPNQDGVSMGPLMALIQNKALLDSWTKLKDAIVEGGDPFEKFHGVHFYEYASLNPSFNQVMNTAMFHRTNLVIGKVLETYKGFEELNQLVDVGGGIGHTLKAITSKYPHIKAINFDLPHVVQHGLIIPGVEHVGGDMFESVPKGNAMFIKSVVHNFEDEQCLKMLKNCYKALPDNGKVIIMEAVLPDMPESSISARPDFHIDLQLMTIFEGVDRTKHEFLALATAAGFRGIRFICYVCNYWIMEFFK